MPLNPEQQVDEIVARVRESAKYQAISADLIRGVARRELAARRRSLAEQVIQAVHSAEV